MLQCIKFKNVLRNQLVTLNDGLLYICDGYSRMQIVDVHDPRHPALLGFIDGVGSPRAVAVAGGTAYLAAGDSGLHVIDVSDPVAPVVVGSLSEVGKISTVAVVTSDTICVADSSLNRMLVLDVSNPANPFELGSVPVAGDPRSISVQGKYVYAACGGSGLSVFDLSTPTAPVQVAVLDDPPSVVVDLELSGGYAFLAAFFLASSVADVSVPTAPSLACPGTTGLNTSRTIAVEGECAYLTHGSHGFSVFCAERSRGGAGDRRGRIGG